ncbi:MAG: hypothetical protein QM753_18470 [Thermomicrobiales bacterium]
MPLLPAGLFPQPATAFLGSAATATRTSPELVALPFLALTGALVGNRATLDKSAPGWIQLPTLWVALVVAPSGCGKTPAIAAATEPFRQLEANLTPPDHGLLTAETSPARIADHLAARPGVAVVQDELVGFVRALNQLRRADDRQRMLSLEQPSHRHQPQRLQRSTIPSSASSAASRARVVPRLRSRDHDGLIERFLPIVADPVAADGASPQIARRVAPHLTPLIDWLTPLARLQSSETGSRRITRSPEAAAHGLPGTTQTSTAATPPLPPSVASISSSRPGRPPRPRPPPALHHRSGPAARAATMQRATALGEFIRIHIHRLAILLGHTGPIPTKPTPTLERRILRTLAETANPDGWVPRTELYERVGRPARPVLAATLDTLLAQRAIVSRIERPTGPGRPITTYRLT